MLQTVCLAQSFKAVVPFGGNAWVNAPAAITDTGLTKWTSPKSTAKVYFRVSVPQQLNLSLRLRVPSGKSTLSVTIGKSVFTRQITNSEYDTIAISQVDIIKPGHVEVAIKGISKTGKVYAEITDLIINYTKPDNDIEFVKQGSSFHFGRRGPSVHLRYHIPADVKTDVRWFYNEITVPVGNDLVGSYFMADGFGEGYFGMQVNSKTERRVLFSVWSPFNTEDPKAIPDSMKIKLLKKGAGVHGGEFGNEGSGGQSYKQLMWQAGKTYAFLLGAEPDSTHRTTTYTAYFKDITANRWYLIASFRRPQKATYLTSLYSFLENFEPEEGNITRMAYYGNQCVTDSKGSWEQLTGVTYTGDATAKAKYRKDYAGGMQNGKFFLKNCGFFDGFVPLNTSFTRPATGIKPVIDISSLPTE
ncbi:hypothetical protein A0256_22945 [Mucilaginibacter sp. PAMC 26640]|nr:hypothetical protein A0256_22945 [Mucilaginibacter sp. PAMC 26640]